MSERVTAVYRPRKADVLIIRPDVQSFPIPADQALHLADALRVAFAVPEHAEALACGHDHGQNAWNAR